MHGIEGIEIYGCVDFDVLFLIVLKCSKNTLNFDLILIISKKVSRPAL